MLVEDLALSLIKELEHVYFVERDLPRVLSCLDEDVVWLGTGEQEFCQSLVDARALFRAQEAVSPRRSFSILHSWYRTRPISSQACLLYGITVVQEAGQDSQLGPQSVRISAVCRLADGAPRLGLVHISLPSPDQSEDEVFPSTVTKQNRKYLRRMLDQQSAELTQRNQYLEALTNSIPGGVQQRRNDPALTIVHVSQGFLAMFGYSEGELAELFDNQFIQMIHPDDRERLLRSIRAQSGHITEVEYRVKRRDGGYLWVLDRGQPLPGPDGKECFTCILVDIDHIKRAQEQLRYSLERHQIIMNQTNDIIFEWDIDDDRLIFSSNWEKKFGYHPITERISERIPARSHVHPEDGPRFVAIMEDVRRGVPYTETELRIQTAQKRYIWCRIRATTQFDGQNRPIKAIGVILDIDLDKKNSQQLLEKAERDALTKLYNKGTAQALVASYLEERAKQEQSAMFIIDIDYFKQINDTLGHLCGDALLTEIAAEIRRQFRQIDIIGRIGGDEFMVLLKDVPDARSVLKKASTLVREFEKIAVSDRQISCSIGIAMCPAHGHCFQDLYRKADLALYRAKSLGRNRAVLYQDADMESALAAAAGHKSAVNETIDSDQGARALNNQLVEYVFRILYQSINIEAAVQQILEIVGRRLDVSRAYIFEADGQVFSNTFEWCGEGVTPEKERLQRLPLDGYQDNFDSNGIFYCRDIAGLPAAQYDLLASQGIKSMLQCVIRDGGVFQGFVGFDECRANRYWTQDQIDALAFIAEILSTFLLKKRAQDRVARAAQGMRAVLDNQSSWIYVISARTHQLLYFNKRAQAVLPGAELGGRCYETFFHRDSPCESCPARQLGGGQKSCSVAQFNPALGADTLTDVTQITWEGEEAFLFSCVDAGKYMKG